MTGFEPAASCSQSKRSAKLSYTPETGQTRHSGGSIRRYANVRGEREALVRAGQKRTKAALRNIIARDALWQIWSILWEALMAGQAAPSALLIVPIGDAGLARSTLHPG